MKRVPAYYLIVALVLITCFATAFSCKKNEGDNTPIIPPDTTKDTTSLSRDVEVWITRPDKVFLLRQQVVALQFNTLTNQFPTITVDSTQTFQTIDGFGFAMTGGSAYLINRLPSTQRDALIRELFSSDSGCLGISYVRISIGASDLDASVFSYDNLPAGQSDPDLNSFSIAKDKIDLIPVLKTALQFNPALKILGSPWSAPTWMKTNNNSVGGSLEATYYDAYARYFVKYIQAMQAEGVPIEAITPQNEPLNPNNNPSMYMTSDEQKNFIKNNLGPAFHEANLTTKIIVYDHNCDHPEYAINILNDADANQYVDGSAFHLYAGDISALTQTHLAHPDKNVYFTEQWVGGPSNFGPDLQWHVKNLIIGATRNWSKNVLEWNLASDPYYKPHTDGGCNSCEGALTIASSVSRNVSYYIIAHASMFVKTGSVRIGSDMPTHLPNVAFKTPEGRKVLIVLNENSSKQSFNIKYGGRQAVASLDAGVVATFVW